MERTEDEIMDAEADDITVALGCDDDGDEFDV
jgi:hypothetical protein